MNYELYEDDDDEPDAQFCANCGYVCSGHMGQRNFCSSSCYEEWQDREGDLWG